MENLPQLPTVGRVVHLADSRFSGQPVAGVVTAVIAESPTFAVNVMGFTPNGACLPYSSIPHVGSAPDGWQGATWAWPPRP